MSATDELRRLLDERGIRWESADLLFHDNQMTYWKSGGCECRAIEGEHENAGKVRLNIDGTSWTTPAQAVEMTLERGKCHNAETREGRFACSACGFFYSAWGGFGYACGDEPDFRYCPECGREVER